MEKHTLTGFTLALCIMFICSQALGAAPTRIYTYTSGETIEPNEVTTNEDNIYSYLQTGVDVIKDGAIVNADINAAANIAASKLDATVVETNTTQTITGEKNFTGNFKLNGVAITSSAAELNVLDGITADVDELNYTEGVTSAIQTQLDTKGNTFTDIYTSSGTWTAPAGVTYITVSMVGGGAGGAGGTDGSSGGGGGGAGAYIVNAGLTVVAEDDYTVTVGTGGAGGLEGANGVDGGDTSLEHAGGTLTCPGGNKGLTANAAGGTGGEASGSHDGGNGAASVGGIAGTHIIIAGGDGGDGQTVNDGSGGGGGSSLMGLGSAGASHEADPVDASNYGGGGGGSAEDGATGRFGGAGSGGIVIIKYKK